MMRFRNYYIFFISIIGTLFFNSSANSEIINYRADKNPRLMIFVHGIIGDRNTWKSDVADFAWPEMIVSDSSFLNFDVISYEYPSSLLSQSYTIDGLAQRFEIELRQWIGNTNYEDIVFVAHSMGGLVTRKMLLNDEVNIGKKTRMLATFSTPMAGSNLANILGNFGGSKLVKNMRISQQSDTENFLAVIRKDWRKKRMSRTIRTYCAYETKPIARWRAVEPASSELLCDSDFVEIPRNHFQMVKPRNSGDYPYIVLKDWLSQEFVDVRTTAATQTTDLLLANCSVGSLGENVETTIEEALYDVGASFGHSKLLPKNWQFDYKPSNVFWHAAPKKIVVHLNCFRDKGTDTKSYVERTQDFIRFSQNMSSLGIKLFVYSQAFVSDSNFMQNHVNRSLPSSYIKSGGIQTFAIKAPSRIKRDGTIDKLRNALERFVNS